MGKKSKAKKEAKRAAKLAEASKSTVVLRDPIVMKFPPGILARAKQRPQRLAADGQRPNPFLPSATLHPPGVLPKDRPTLAQDDALCGSGAWGIQSLLYGAYDEGQTFMGYPELSLMSQRPEYRRMVETIARHMTRKWIKIKSASEDENKKDKIKKIEAAMERLNVKGMFQRIAEQDGYFGRAHLYIDLGTTDDRAELLTPIGDGLGKASAAKIGKGDLKRLTTVEAVWCYPNQYNSNDPLDPSWYRPGSWFVMGKELDASRLLTFVGREVADMLKPAYSFGGLALTQLAKPYVDNWLRTRQSVSDIVSAFSVMVLATNMAEQLGSGNDGGVNEGLFTRADFFNAMRDNRGLFMIDKDGEDFKNIAAPLTGLDTLQAQSQEHMCSVAGIPIVIYLGIQPAGLNATSEGEIEVFDDWIHSSQEQLFRPNLTRVFRFVQLSELGAVDPDLTFDFEPLRSATPKEQAEINELNARADAELVEAGILNVEEPRQRIATDPDSPYHGIKVDDAPKLPEPDLADGGGNGPDPESDEPE